uniref:Uncharacterized protein n=1 Tax=Arundo donax TaxID=35708 RepID=A0A0A9H6T7_ARUDO
MTVDNIVMSTQSCIVHLQHRPVVW